MRRPAELASNLRFTVSFVVGALVTDPAWLVLQAARRLPPRLSTGVVPWVERVVGDGTSGRAGRLRAAWSAGDVATVRAAAPRGRTAARVRRTLLAQVALLSPTSDPAPTHPVTAPDGRLAVHHHLTNSLPHTQSGYTLRTHAVLTAQRAAGYAVTASTRAGYPLTVGVVTARGTDVIDGIAYRRLVPRTARRTARDEAETALLLDALHRARPTVVHATTPWTTGEVARRAARTAGLPWVYEVRGLPEETWAASHATPAERDVATRSARYALIRAKETELALAADHVVTLSATMRAELTARGVPPHQVTVVPNAVDGSLLETATPAPAAARATLGLPPRRLLGTVSSIVAYEGLETILRTVARLRADGHDVGALVVGDGVARPALARLAAALGIADVVHLPGRVPRSEARAHLSALDVVLVPRRPDRVTRLVTPLKPVEAMACGRPVVASDLPALAEALSPLGGGAPAGLLVPADDVAAWAGAVGLVLTDDATRDAMVAAGREIAAQRTWERMVRRYQEAYQAAADASAARTATG